MFQMNENDIVGKAMDEQYKENYIADMLVCTLYSNDVNKSECYHIIELFTKKVLDDHKLTDTPIQILSPNWEKEVLEKHKRHNQIIPLQITNKKRGNKNGKRK